MNILCTNDDGYLTTGIRILAAAAGALGSDTVVAPDREQSATSHSLTLHHPLRARRTPDGAWIVDGTPTDCVILAVQELIDGRPDLCVSGVNHGPNMGEDVLYSGTVAAAIEGRFLGLPTMAVSMVPGEGRVRHFETGARVARILVDRLLSEPLHQSTILNVNVPDLPFEDIRGFEATRLGYRHRAEPVVKSRDPRGRKIYWVGMAGPGQDAGPGTDFHAVANGFVSVTPLQVDLTRHGAIEGLRSWLQGPAT
ncbi:MAG TPA: 5'/3'-nucleotidase SurE [Longimicrobiales bacterium]|nr:5'/3'-nucleotidase SurE [Longimicrobiales bacterium]